MTLARHLAETGVLLDQDIGFIIDTRDSTDTWIATQARIARVYKIPDDKQVLEYNPDSDLLVECKSCDKSYVIALRLRADATIYEPFEGGLFFSSPNETITVGQSETFMEEVFLAWWGIQGEL